MSLEGVCPKNFGSGLPYGIASEVSNLVSEASKPSAGASWQRPTIGRPISASLV